MKTKKLATNSGAVLILLLISLFIFPQLVAQDNDQLTQSDLVDMLIGALGLEDELGATATMEEKVDKLMELGYAPPGGWDLGEPLRKRDVDVVLAQISQDQASGDIGEEFSLKDLKKAINKKSSPPGWDNRPPHREPVSPKGWENAARNRD